MLVRPSAQSLPKLYENACKNREKHTADEPGGYLDHNRDRVEDVAVHSSEQGDRLHNLSFYAVGDGIDGKLVEVHS